jgi:carboxypeptidase C (cathepsin A)
MADEDIKNDKGKEDAGKPEPEDRIVTTRHSLRVRGKELKYTATVGTVVLREEVDKEGHKAKAEMFFIAFTRDGVRNLAKRPVTFSFNGGPGSSSVWMLLGLLGPRRVPLAANDNERIAPPFQLSDNEYTLLEETDLVFIDPVGTGYSRPLSGEQSDPNEFFSFRRDLESVGEFIRLYTSRNRRWSSPKFRIGESYGTTRAAGLSGHLQDRHGLFLNGVMLVSAVLNFQTLLFREGNDLPYVLYLPSYAITARYHGKLARKYRQMAEPKFIAEVREFAESDYNLALMKGDRLDGPEREEIVQRLVDYTGLDEQYIRGSNLRIPIMRFVKEILRSDGKCVGRFDSRITGTDKDDVSENFERDPSFDIVQGVYSACLNDFVRSELEFESDLPYEILSFKILPRWRYDDFQNSYVNTAEILRGAMMKNPHMKVFVANGLYDLATPFFATEYTVDHLGLRGDVRNNIQLGYYDAGHMMYVNRECLASLSGDLKRFIKG